MSLSNEYTRLILTSTRNISKTSDEAQSSNWGQWNSDWYSEDWWWGNAWKSTDGEKEEEANDNAMRTMLIPVNFGGVELFLYKKSPYIFVR